MDKFLPTPNLQLEELDRGRGREADSYKTLKRSPDKERREAGLGGDRDGREKLIT